MELDPAVRIVSIRPGELGPADIAAWQSMQRATPSLANPFLSPEFAVAVGHFRPGARVGVMTEGQSVAGFFPFERRRLGAGGPICGWLTPCQGLVHAPGVEWDPRELLRGCGLSAWRFDNLIADQGPFKPYHEAAVPSAVIDLSDGFDAYYAKLRVKASRFCRELDRRARKLARELGELRVMADSRDTAVLRTLMAWKSDQYRQTSHVDRFQQPWLAGLLDDLLATRGGGAGACTSGLLSVLYAGDRPVAAQFGLRTGNLFVGWFTGYDTRLHSYSPGLLHLRQLAGELAAAGVSVIDMGAGARNYYKETLKTGDVFVAQGVVTARSVLGAAHRVRGVLTWSARRAFRERPSLHRAADQIVRRSGIASRIYGRILKRHDQHIQHGRGRIGTASARDLRPAPAAERVLCRGGRGGDGERRPLLRQPAKDEVVQRPADALAPPRRAYQQFGERERAAGMLAGDFRGQRRGQPSPPGGRRPERHPAGIPDEEAAVPGLREHEARLAPPHPEPPGEIRAGRAGRLLGVDLGGQRQQIFGVRARLAAV